jgi:hypothetical protein
MPILILNNSEHPQGLILTDRVLIGRRPFNGIMLPDPAVSRLHAWIGWREGRYVLFDAGSRQGTLVNARPLTAPHALAEGDEIRIGPATITYHDADTLPGDVAPLEPPPARPASDPYDDGIYFDCACGGPMWVAATLAGATGRCRYCGERLVVPHVSGGKARPMAPASAAQPPAARATKPRPPSMPQPTTRPPAAPHAPATLPPPKIAAPPTAPPAPVAEPVPPTPEMLESPCSICQTPIQPGEDKTACPSCHLTFHTQCWQENFGCSAYGCDQVNILAPAAAPAEENQPAAEPVFHQASDADIPHSSFPLESVLLALSFVCLALGALTFGLSSAAMLILTLILQIAKKPRRKGIMLTALTINLIGCLAGYATSKFLWQDIRIWEKILK